MNSLGIELVDIATTVKKDHLSMHLKLYMWIAIAVLK